MYLVQSASADKLMISHTHLQKQAQKPPEVETVAASISNQGLNACS